MHSLQQGVANSMDDPSGDLAIDDRRIDHLPTVVRHDVVQYLHSAGFDVHFHDRNRGSLEYAISFTTNASEASIPGGSPAGR